MLQNLKQLTRGIDFFMKSDKTDCTCFKEVPTISILNGKLLKFVDKFTYLDSNILSTESDVKLHREKSCTAIDSFSIIWK